MKFLQNLFLSKEIKLILIALDEIGEHFKGGGYAVVRNEIEAGIRSEPKGTTKIVAEGEAPREFVHKAIMSIAGNHLASGKFHEHWGDRGRLNLHGEEMLRVFDTSVEYLCKIDVINEQTAQEQKEIIREKIQSVG